MNTTRLSAALLLISLASRVACAEFRELGAVGPATISFDVAKGLDGLEVAVDGVRFQPLAGAAALDADGKPDATIPLQVEAAVTDGVLRIELATAHAVAHGLDPGLVQGLGEWRSSDLSRYSEPHGQTWWPKTTYSVAGDFWFTAHWVMAESNGSRWTAIDERNLGNEPFPAALSVIYEPDTEGSYLPIREVLELRFSTHLWDVVPGPRQKPSEYREFLTQSVFVDLWGGASAGQMNHLLQVLKAIGRGERTYYTVLQNWETCGWDTLLPDSM